MKYIVVVQALCAVLVYTLLSSESLIVPDEYLVIMSNDSTKSMCDNAIAELINLAGESATNIHQYTILKGFSVNIDKIYEQDLKQLTGVAYVERQVIMTATDISWGQDRIDQRLLPLNGVYDPPGDGTGVNVYVLDTGIRQPKGNSDNEFDTRVTDFYDTQSTRKLCNSHGTRMAGIIGSHSYGVATKVKLHSVRVLNCENAGRLSDILAGLDFVLANGITPGVILMALSGPKVESLDQAIASADAAGFVVITAAGNNGDDACFYSPASSDKAITVAATSSRDHETWYSNYGSCVDIFAPGNYIKTLDLDKHNVVFASGTSVAAAFVGGIAAIHLQTNPSLTPTELKTIITNSATSGEVWGEDFEARGNPNLLAYIDPYL